MQDSGRKSGKTSLNVPFSQFHFKGGFYAAEGGLRRRDGPVSRDVNQKGCCRAFLPDRWAAFGEKKLIDQVGLSSQTELMDDKESGLGQ